MSTCATTRTCRSSCAKTMPLKMACIRASTRKKASTPTRRTWDYEIGEDGYAKVDPTLEHPRCVYQMMKKHYARYTTEMVERTCGVSAGQVPQGGRNAGVDCRAGTRRHHPVRAGLDPPLDRRADHPHRRHGAAVAGQYGHRRRRHERLARPLEHPGPDRPGPDVEPAARLHDPAERGRAGLRRLYRRARHQAAAAEPAQLLAAITASSTSAS